MATNNQAVGVVTATKGEVFARGEDGKMRRLNTGDQILEHDVIVTANGSSADISMFNAPPLSVAEQQTISVDAQVTAVAPDATAASVAPLGSTEAAKVIQTVATGSGLDVNALLEDDAAAAGLTGGDGADGGHTFVDLMRIVENVPGAGYDFPAYGPGTAPILEGQILVSNGLPTAGDLTIAVDEDDLSTRPWDESYLGWQAEFQGAVGYVNFPYAQGNSDVVDNSDDLPDPSPTVLAGNLNFSYGPDGMGSTGGVVFNPPTEALTSGGEPIQYWVSADGHTVVGYIGESYQPEGPVDTYSVAREGYEGVTVIFTAQITDAATGAFAFTLYGPLDHSAAGTEDNLIIPLSFTVTDASGDYVTGSLTVNVDDDSPVLLGGTIDSDGVVTGTIEATGSGGNDGEGEGNGYGYGTTVDTWYFTVNQAGPVTIDVRAKEDSVDLNGDGERTELDSYIYVFTNDNGQPGTLVASNDDSYSTFGDGSTHHYDSYLNLNLPAGSYIVRIGGFSLSEQEARDEVNDSSSTGDYQITFGGNVTVSSSGGSGADNFSLEEESASVPPGNDETNDGLSSSGYGTIVDNVAWGADGFGAVTQVSVGEIQVDLPEYGSAMIYFDANGNATLNSGDAAVSLEVYANGGYAIEVLGPLHHAAGEGENILELPQILITGVDKDGDPVNVPVNVTVQDDVPVLTQRTVNVTVDEDDILTPWSVGTSPNDGTGDGSSTGGPSDPFWGPQAAYTSGSLASVVSGGADQPLTFEFTQDAIAQMQALHLYSKQTALPENGLELTYTITNVGGYSILTASEPDTAGPGNTGNPVFELRLNEATGAFEFRLFDELIHVAPESGADENTALRSGAEGSVDGINFGAIIQAVDDDGDAISLSGAFTVTVRDDIPIVDIGLARSVVVEHDESAGVQDDDTSHLPGAIASMFNAISNRGDDTDVAGSGAIGFARSDAPVVVISHSTEVGADSPALNSEFALQVTDQNSGLKTTEGESVLLFKEGDVIVGRVGSANGQAAFAITIDDDGELFVAQYLSLQHPNTSSSDETIDLAGKVSISYSITDSDGDTVTDVVNIGSRIEFGDDGPSADCNATVRLDDDALAGGNSGGYGDDANAQNTSGTLAHTFGADGGSIAWLTNGAPDGFSYETVGSNLLIKQGGTTVLTLTLDANSGDYTVTQNAAIHHSAGDFENNQVFSVGYRVTDGDGDKANGTLTINVDDDTPVVYSNAAVQLDDDALPGGNTAGSGDVNPDTANTIGVLSHSYGADGGSMAWLTTGAPAGFSYVASGSDLLIKQGGTTVMTLTLNTATGAYTVTQNAAIDHAAGSNENDVAFTVKYRVTDGDNDRQDGTLTINVDDDTPTVSTNAAVQLDDDALAGGNIGGVGDVSPDTANTSGTLSHSYGADGGSIAWLTEGAPSGFAYVASGNNLLIKQDGTTVMTLTLNTSTGAYTVTQNAAIDHPAGLNENDLAFTVKYQVTDGDGDKVPGSLTINVDDDTPTIDVSSAVTYTLHVANYGETEAGFHNSFGYYIKAADGTPTSGMVVWDDVKDFENGSVDITGYTPDQVGFFIIPDGDNFNPGLAAGTAVTFALVDGKWQAFAGATPLVGDGANVLFDVQALNADGFNHLQDNSKPGNLNWEDIAGGGDLDWDDVNIGVTWTSNLPVLTTQDAQTIGAASDSAFASFASMFSVNALVGADGLGSSATTYKLSVTNADAGLTSDGKAIALAMVGNDVVGSTTDGEVFRISVDASGKVTLTQAREVDHLPEDIDANNDNAMLRLADGKVALTATATITDADGDVASDSQKLDISSAFRFEDDLPSASNITKSLDEDSSIDINLVTQGSVSYGADGVGSITLASNPLHGTVTLTNGVATYKPNAEYSGSDSFTYTVIDGDNDTVTKTVSLTVTPVNDPPVANADTNWVLEDATSAVTGNVLQTLAHGSAPDAVSRGDVADTDIDSALTVTGFTGGNAYGTLTLNPSGSYSYALNSGLASVQALDVGEKLTETYTYTVTDGTTPKTATLTITIFGQNDAPVANADTNWVLEDAASAVTGNVLESQAHNGAPDAAARGDVADTDVDVETLTVTGYTGGNAYGTLTLNANGSYSYALNNSNATVQALNDGDKLTETYTYTVSDGTATKTATLTITIFGANDPVLVVGENVNDNSNQTVDHRVDTSPYAPDGSIDGSSSHDVLVGDVGGNNQLAGQKANIAFVLDCSGSMTQQSISFTDSNGVSHNITRLDALKQAVIDALNDLYASGANDVRVHIDSFASNIGSSGTFTLTSGGVDSATQLQAAINFVNGLSVPSDQYTNYEAGLVAANSWIESSGANAPISNADVNKVIFVSDGAPNRALATGGQVVEVSADDAINHIQGDFSGWLWVPDLGYRNQTDTVSEISLIETDGSGSDQAFSIEAVGISVDSGALSNLSLVEGAGGAATNVDNANELSTVIGTLTGGGTVAQAVGNDVINGGAGNDLIFGDSVHADNVDGGWAKFVQNHSGWSLDALRAELYANHATYGQEGSVGGNDTIDGGAGNDVIYGQKGNDSITGGAGDDLIVGGSGSDTMSGGTGADTFKFVLGDAGTTGTIDHISDFSRTSGDVLDFRDLLAGEDGVNPGYNLGGFMSVAKSGANTILTISDTNGTATGGASQTIVFDNTDLFGQFGVSSSGPNASENLLKAMITDNKLLVNG